MDIIKVFKKGSDKFLPMVICDVRFEEKQKTGHKKGSKKYLFIFEKENNPLFSSLIFVLLIFSFSFLVEIFSDSIK